MITIDETPRWDFAQAHQLMLESERLRLGHDYFGAAANAQWALEALDPSFGKAYGNYADLDLRTFGKLLGDQRKFVLQVVLQIARCEWESLNPGRTTILLSKFSDAFDRFADHTNGYPADRYAWSELMWVSKYVFEDAMGFRNADSRCTSSDSSTTLLLSCLDASLDLFEDFAPDTAEARIHSTLVDLSAAEVDPRPKQLALNTLAAAAMFRLDLDGGSKRYEEALSFARTHGGSVRSLLVEATLSTSPKPWEFGRSGEHNRQIFEIPPTSLDQRTQRLLHNTHAAAFCGKYEDAMRAALFGRKLSQAYGLYSRARTWARILADLPGQPPYAALEWRIRAGDGAGLNKLGSDSFTAVEDSHVDHLLNVAEQASRSPSHRGVSVVLGLRFATQGGLHADLRGRGRRIVEAGIGSLDWNYTTNHDQVGSVLDAIVSVAPDAEYPERLPGVIVKLAGERVNAIETPWRERRQWIACGLDLMRAKLLTAEEELDLAGILLSFVEHNSQHSAADYRVASQHAELRPDIELAWTYLVGLARLRSEATELRTTVGSLLNQIFCDQFGGTWAHFIAWMGVEGQIAEDAAAILLAEHEEDLNNAREGQVSDGGFDPIDGLIWLASCCETKTMRDLMQAVIAALANSVFPGRRRQRILVTLLECLQRPDYEPVRRYMATEMNKTILNAGANVESVAPTQNPLFRDPPDLSVALRVHWDYLIALVLNDDPELDGPELIERALQHLRAGSAYVGAVLRTVTLLWSSVGKVNRIECLVLVHAIAKTASRPGDQRSAKHFYEMYRSSIEGMPELL